MSPGLTFSASPLGEACANIGRIKSSPGSVFQRSQMACLRNLVQRSSTCTSTMIRQCTLNSREQDSSFRRSNTSHARGNTAWVHSMLMYASGHPANAVHLTCGCQPPSLISCRSGMKLTLEMLCLTYGMDGSHRARPVTESAAPGCTKIDEIVCGYSQTAKAITKVGLRNNGKKENRNKEDIGAEAHKQNQPLGLLRSK